MTEKQILKLIAKLPKRSEVDADALLTDLLCLTYPSRSTQDN